MTGRKCIFLDRDGVLNEERGEYTYKLNDFNILNGVPDALKMLKENGYLLIVITNQAGIAKGLYSAEDVMNCHNYLQGQTGSFIDDIYYCPHHPITTQSLLRKPNSLMLEKAMAKWNIDPKASFMVGDSKRDIEAAERVGVKGILIGDKESPEKETPHEENLWGAVQNIILI